MMHEGEVIALLSVVFGATVILFPIMRALAERIRPRALDPGVREELQALREDLLSELQQTRHDIGDLNERLDFAERVLIKKAEQP
jgi:hypothetical protein